MFGGSGDGRLSVEACGSTGPAVAMAIGPQTGVNRVVAVGSQGGGREVVAAVCVCGSREGVDDGERSSGSVIFGSEPMEGALDVARIAQRVSASLAKATPTDVSRGTYNSERPFDSVLT